MPGDPQQDQCSGLQLRPHHQSHPRHRHTQDYPTPSPLRSSIGSPLDISTPPPPIHGAGCCPCSCTTRHQGILSLSPTSLLAKSGVNKAEKAQLSGTSTLHCTCWYCAVSKLSPNRAKKRGERGGLSSLACLIRDRCFFGSAFVHSVFLLFPISLHLDCRFLSPSPHLCQTILFFMPYMYSNLLFCH